MICNALLQNSFFFLLHRYIKWQIIAVSGKFSVPVRKYQSSNSMQKQTPLQARCVFEHLNLNHLGISSNYNYKFNTNSFVVYNKCAPLSGLLFHLCC